MNNFVWVYFQSFTLVVQVILDSIRCCSVKGWKSLGWEEVWSLAEVSLYCGKGYISCCLSIALCKALPLMIVWVWITSSGRFNGRYCCYCVGCESGFLCVTYVPLRLLLSCDLYPHGNCNIISKVLGFLTPSTADFIIAYAYYIDLFWEFHNLFWNNLRHSGAFQILDVSSPKSSMW